MPRRGKSRACSRATSRAEPPAAGAAVADGRIRAPDGEDGRSRRRRCWSAAGWSLPRGKVAQLNDFGAFDLLTAVRDGTKLSVPLDQRDDLMKTLFGLPRLPRLDLPPELQVAESAARAQAPADRQEAGASPATYADDRLIGMLSFDYAGKVVTPTDVGQVVFSPPRRRSGRSKRSRPEPARSRRKGGEAVGQGRRHRRRDRAESPPAPPPQADRPTRPAARPRPGLLPRPAARGGLCRPAAPARVQGGPRLRLPPPTAARPCGCRRRSCPRWWRS